MPIVRIAKHTHPFVTIDRRPLENPNLSWRAKGLLTYLLSRPSDWTVQMTHLESMSTDGKTGLRSIMHELRRAGHAQIEQRRSPDGKHGAGTEWVIYEERKTRDERKPESQETRDSGFSETLVFDALTKKDTTTKKDTNAQARECEEVWKAYPRKVAKPSALTAIRKAIKAHGYLRVLAATRRFAVIRPDKNDSYTPHPATWFNQQRYNDDPATWESKAKGQKGAPVKTRREIEADRKLDEEMARGAEQVKQWKEKQRQLNQKGK